MNLVRLSFIVSMAGLAGYALYSAVTRPYQPPVVDEVIQQAVVRCVSGGGYYNEGYFFMAVCAMAAALTVACIDLARRVY